MKNIIDIGKQGAEHMDIEPPTPSAAIGGIQKYTPFVDRFPVERMDCEVNDGTKHRVEIHKLLLNNPQVFSLIHEMAIYEPMVYARKGKRLAMGILSPNFDEHGKDRLPTVKVLPLKVPYPLVSRGGELLPDAQMATMLAGSAHAEGKGSGGHDKNPAEDYEHRLAILGAISLNKTTITDENGYHIQHAERNRTSVATGLTNGKLGQIYIPDNSKADGFSGYDIPLIFQQGSTERTDAIFIPKGFLHNEASYGVNYADASQIAYGVGLRNLHARQGQTTVSDQIKRISDLL